MPTYKITLEYEGTRFSGWQAQGNTPKTVQGHILKAATQVWGKVDVGGAGRTDSGVHAAGQVAHLKLSKKVPQRDIERNLNDLLPHDISVLRVEETHDRFHARHDATSRTYLYQISKRRTAFAKPFVWWVKDRLDGEAMKTASKLLVGRHDFSALTDRRAENESTIVVVEKLEMLETSEMILVRITASHYLWKMVRKIVSALAEVGRGAMSVREFGALLEPGAEKYQPTAPPSGLFLEGVTYEGETFDRPLQPLIPVLPRFIRKEGADEKPGRRTR